MIVELVTLLSIVAGGSALLHLLGMRGWGLPFVGFATGIALFILVGFVQVVTFLPTSPVLTICVAGGVPVALWVTTAIRRPALRPRIRDALLWPAVTAVAIVALSAVARWVNLVTWSPDSFQYLMSGSLIAEGQYGAASGLLVEKRLISVPLLHSAGNLDGQWYLPAMTPAIAIAVLGTLAWFAWAALRDTVPTRFLIVAIVLGIAVLASINRFTFHAFYVNGNLLFGLLLLLLIGSAWLLMRGGRVPHPVLRAIMLSTIPALVVTRAEASLVVALGLLPLLLTDRVTFAVKAGALAVLGASTVVWQVRVAAAYLGEGLALPISVIALLVFGVLAIAAIAILRWRWLMAHARWLLWGVLAALWLVLAVLALRKRDVLIDSVTATVQNVVRGAGSWGWSIMMIGLLVFAALVVFRFTADRQLTFVMSAFIPLAFLLPYFREDPYRVGDGDSLNRIIMAFVPVAVLFVIAAACEGRFRWARERADGSVPLRSTE